MPQAADRDLQPHRRAAGTLGRHDTGDGVIFILVQHRRRQELRLRRTDRRQGLAVPQDELPALPDAVALVALSALLAPDGIDRVDILLLIPQAQGGPLRLQSLEALHRRQLPHHRALHGDLPAAAVHGHTGIYHDGEVVQAVHAQAADDAAAEHHLVEETALMIVVGLFRRRRGQNED